MVTKVGYDGKELMYYHFCVPNEGFDFGLRALGNDDDVRLLASYVGLNKVIRVFIEHGKTNLLTYFMSPSGRRRVTIEQLEDEAPPIQAPAIEAPPIEAPVQNADELGLSLALYVTETPELGRKSGWKQQKGGPSCSKKLNMDDVAGVDTHVVGDSEQVTGVTDDCDRVNLNELPVNIDEDGYRVNLEEEPFQFNELPNNIDEEYVRNFDILDGFTVGSPMPVTENINQDQQQQEVAESESDSEYEGDNKNGSDDSEAMSDSEYFFDEENIIEDVEVDMEDFNSNIDTEAEFVGGLKPRRGVETNAVSDEGEGLEV